MAKVEINQEIKDRFKTKFLVADSGCWEFKSSINKKGYGVISYKGRLWRAHVLSFVIYKGDLIEGLIVMHSCDNRKCVNPAHLSLGTHSDNMRDAMAKGRWKPILSARKTTHPSMTDYVNGCKCQECRDVAKEYRKKYRVKKSK